MRKRELLEVIKAAEMPTVQSDVLLSVYLDVLVMIERRLTEDQFGRLLSIGAGIYSMSASDQEK
jgi:hypothetical protein